MRAKVPINSAMSFCARLYISSLRARTAAHGIVVEGRERMPARQSGGVLGRRCDERSICNQQRLTPKTLKIPANAQMSSRQGPNTEWRTGRASVDNLEAVFLDDRIGEHFLRDAVELLLRFVAAPAV